MELAREDILALVEQTWQTLFGSPIELAEPTLFEVDAVRATIAISGAWQGQVRLDLSASAAEEVACGLLEAKPGELEPDAIFDAAGEMANILAGNLKSMLPQPSKLGLPVTFSGSALQESPDSWDANPQIVAFLWNSTPISVTIVESSRTRGS